MRTSTRRRSTNGSRFEVSSRSLGFADSRGEEWHSTRSTERDRHEGPAGSFVSPQWRYKGCTITAGPTRHTASAEITCVIVAKAAVELRFAWMVRIRSDTARHPCSEYMCARPAQSTVGRKLLACFLRERQ